MPSTENRIFIGLGSNQGDSHSNLDRAVKLIEARFQTTLVTSGIYYSEPVEFPDQPWFFNQVAYFNAFSDLRPTKVLKVLKEIEAELGRIPGERYGPRPIDLDLLLFQNWVFESYNLVVPHPKMAERLFVLAPLFELDPDLIHPHTELSIRQIIANNSSRFSRCEKI